MKAGFKVIVFLTAVLIFSSFKTIEMQPTVITIIRPLETSFPFTIKCDDPNKDLNLKAPEVPEELVNFVVVKKFNSGNNIVFVYVNNGTEEDPLETGVFAAVYTKEFKKISSEYLIDINCGDVNNGGDGSDEKSSVQSVTFKTVNSFSVSREIFSKSKGKSKEAFEYKIDESGKILTVK